MKNQIPLKDGKNIAAAAAAGAGAAKARGEVSRAAKLLLPP